EDHAADPPSVLEDVQLLAGLGIPQPCGMVTIVPTRERIPAIGREGHTPDDVGMARKDMQLLASSGVPQACGLIGAAGEHIFAIGREGPRMYFVRVTDEANRLRRWQGIP